MRSRRGPEPCRGRGRRSPREPPPCASFTPPPARRDPDLAPPDPLDPVAAGLIRHAARRLTRAAGFTPADADDVAQDLTLTLLRRRAAFRPDRAPWPAFVATLVARRAASLARDRRAAKRFAPGVASLDAPFGTAGAPLAASVGRRECSARRGVDPRPDGDAADLALDVRAAVAGLPADDRDLAARLARDPLAAVARDLGVPRTTLADRVRAIRRRFERAGLREYL